MIKNFLFKKTTLILLAILIIGLFFRIYKIDIFYTFEHDQDLYSWIVKDIWIDHHLRLIGQVTSIEGVFIGPLYYYLLIPFYALFGMNPLAATVLATLIGLFTIWSIYFVFSRFFGKTVGFFGAAIYATSLGPVFFERWVVPTQPTMLWCIWFLYTAFSLAEGKTKSILIAAILLGIIWHIHVALLPLMPLLVIAFFLSKQKVNLKIVLQSLVVFFLLSAPFWIFEIKHAFLQTQSLLFTSGGAGRVLTGWERFLKIIDAFLVVLNSSLIQGWNLPRFIGPLVFGLSILFVAAKKLLTKKQLIVVISWLMLVFVIQMITKNPISEYYVINITILPILFIALTLSYLYTQLGLKKLSLALIFLYMILNLFFLFRMPEATHLYAYKKKTVDFIKEDMNKKGYGCMSVSFVAKYGTGVGFRYLIWWEGMHLVKANPQTPLYSIVIPYDSVNQNELDGKFGYFGVILPEEKAYDLQVCDDPALEPIPLLGFTN